jgi:hypothetical protein
VRKKKKSVWSFFLDLDVVIVFGFLLMLITCLNWLLDLEDGGKNRFCRETTDTDPHAKKEERMNGNTNFDMYYLLLKLLIPRVMLVLVTTLFGNHPT